MKNKINICELLISIVITEIIGLISGLLAGNIGIAYHMLEKPPLSPPGWVFPIVWPILYALMGAAGYLIYRNKKEEPSKRKTALLLYSAQLFLNFLWSIIFFRFQAMWLSVIIIVLLCIFVVLTLIKFKNINKTAALLFIPYLVWLLFATYLNIGFAALN